jgi:hypothetical protein
MAITDAERHRLHTELDEKIGEEDAAISMAHLPPSGWSDVVRTRDLDQLEARMNARFERLEARMDAKFDVVDVRFGASDDKFSGAIERALREQTNRYLVGSVALLSIFTALQALLS